MTYFDSNFIDFFKELAGNNHKEWFDENRRTYEESVKKPFEGFITDLITEVRPYFDELHVTAKQSIFRINRDIRFSKDKTPYKLDRTAAITPNGRKDSGIPGIYVNFGPESAKVYGGVYKLDRQQLYKLRTYIAGDLETFYEILKDKGYNDSFGETLHGDKNKVIPKEFREAAEKQPLLYNKIFYYFHKMDPHVIETDELMNTVMTHFKNGIIMKEFLTKGLK